jgi:hypothetical protein
MMSSTAAAVPLQRSDHGPMASCRRLRSSLWVKGTCQPERAPRAADLLVAGTAKAGLPAECCIAAGLPASRSNMMVTEVPDAPTTSNPS